MADKIMLELDKLTEIGDNLQAGMTADGKIVFVVDSKIELGLSPTGKSIGIAKTAGMTLLSSGLKLNFWLGRKAN